MFVSLCLSSICFNYAVQSSCRTGTSEPPVLVALLARYAFLGHRRSAKDFTSNIWRYFAILRFLPIKGYERSCFRKPRTSDIRGTAMLNLRCVVPREASMFLCSCLFWHCQTQWHLSTSDPVSWLAVRCYRFIMIYMYCKYIHIHI